MLHVVTLDNLEIRPVKIYLSKIHLLGGEAFFFYHGWFITYNVAYRTETELQTFNGYRISKIPMSS